MKFFRIIFCLGLCAPNINAYSQVTSPVEVSQITQTGFIISWETFLPANCYIRYGNTPDLELGTISGGLTTYPSIEVTGGTAAQLFYVQAVSEEGSNVYESDTLAFITASASSGEITVYFNRPVNNSYANPGTNLAVQLPQLIDDTLIQYLGRAQETIDVAIYNVAAPTAGISDIVGALNQAHLNGVRVRVIYNEDTGNTGLANINAAIERLESPAPQWPDGHGIMHNKFVVIDAESSNPNLPLVWTGSTNWTTQQINTDANNVIIIQDQSLARTYQLEFEEMWGGIGDAPNPANSRFGPFKKDNTPHVLSINGKRVECYFSPSDNVNSRIIKAVNESENELIVNTMLITRSDITNAINFKHYSGTDVGVLVNHENETSQFPALEIALKGRLADYSTTTGVLHHKIMMSGVLTGTNPYVLTGSHNWSTSAEDRNDENTLIVYDADVVNQYYQEFMQRYEPIVTPIAFDDFSYAVANEAMPVDVTLNDEAFFTANLFVEIVTVPENGTALVSQPTVLEYTASEGYVGLDSIQYRVCNEAFLDFCDTAWVRYQVSLLSLNEFQSVAFGLYPNPGNGEFVISNYSGRNIDRVEVYSASGILCADQSLATDANEIKLNFSNLQSGIYFLTLFGGDYSHTRKLIID